jgi:hypothetical protein
MSKIWWGISSAAMIDKVSGRAIYAVMSFGGFLGMGREVPPATVSDR